MRDSRTIRRAGCPRCCRPVRRTTAKTLLPTRGRSGTMCFATRAGPIVLTAKLRARRAASRAEELFSGCRASSCSKPDATMASRRGGSPASARQAVTMLVSSVRSRKPDRCSGDGAGGRRESACTAMCPAARARVMPAPMPPEAPTTAARHGRGRDARSVMAEDRPDTGSATLYACLCCLFVIRCLPRRGKTPCACGAIRARCGRRETLRWIDCGINVPILLRPAERRMSVQLVIR